MRSLLCLALLLAGIFLAPSTHAEERTFGPLGVQCPGKEEGCAGVCTFTIVLHYDVAPTTSLVSNLGLRFEQHCASESCRGSFDGGRGWLRFVTGGKEHSVTGGGMRGVEQGRRAGLSAADKAELARIEGKGHCGQWTPDEVQWWVDHVAPTSVDGWNLTWVCQGTEPGRGMSVTDIKADPASVITSFDFLFEIQVHTLCGGARSNAQVMKVEASGP